MRKRLRKKWHKKWISDVRIEVSQNDQFVQLIAAARSTRIEINRDNAKDRILWNLIVREIIRHNLRYHVWIEPQTIELIDSDIQGEGFYPFFYLDFCSVGFPSVKSWAGNNLSRFRCVAAKNQKLEH